MTTHSHCDFVNATAVCLKKADECQGLVRAPLWLWYRLKALLNAREAREVARQVSTGLTPYEATVINRAMGPFA